MRRRNERKRVAPPAPPAVAAPPVAAEVPTLLGATFFERALLWERADAALAAAVKAETEARDALLAADFADRAIGTTTKELPDGRLVKCEASLRYAAGETEARACVAELAALGEDGRVLAERLFRFKPDVRVGELKKLPDAMRAIADKAITTKPARPAISIVEATAR